MHGYLSKGQSFYYQTEFFKGDYQIFAPDLKGFGENSQMEYPYSLDDYVQSVKQYMIKNDIVFPHVIAHSFGARIVIKALSEDFDLFDKVVITGGAGLKPKFSFKKSLKRATFKVLKPFFSKERLKVFYSQDYLALSPVMKQSFIKIVNEHLDDKISKLNGKKMLLIYGDKDKQTPLYMAKRIAKANKLATLSIYKGAGHFAFIDCSLKFNLEVKEFLLS